MGHEVTLLPSGRRFTVEPNESILDAALRSGINIPYSCAGGTCGECKARVVAGPVVPTAFHDYVLSEAEKAQGTVLLCSTGAAGDLTIEADESGAADIPRQRIAARIAALHREGRMLLLQLRTPRTRTLRFLAGQYVRLGVDGVGALDAAVASCPCNGLLLEFHLPDAPDPLSRHLHEAARIAEPVTVEGPCGDFILDEASPAPLVMVSEGSGFAPIKSLIEHFIALDQPRALHLYRLDPPGGHYQANVCRAWRDALDSFHLSLCDRSETLLEAVARSAPCGADWYIAGSDALASAAAAAACAPRSLRRFPATLSFPGKTAPPA